MLKRYFLRIIIACGALAIGLFAVWVILVMNKPNLNDDSGKTALHIDEPLSPVGAQTIVNEDEYKEALADYWIDDDETKINGYVIKRECVRGENYDENCTLSIYRNGKRLQEFDSERRNWLSYGFFNFLGGGASQLVIHSYSGGAHCCDDYYIYNLGPKFRELYMSGNYDSGNEIGNELMPIDIDDDGIFEFQQRVMAFDYFRSSHADSVFPLAIFAYDPKKGRYELANRKFPKFVLDETKKGSDWLTNHVPVPSGMDKRWLTRLTFLNLVYAGNEKEAWKYFDENYWETDKEDYRREVKNVFRHDPTYKSIYSR